MAGYGVVPISIAFTLFVNLLEILIAFIQAYIFTILSALFIGMAMAEHPHEEHDKAHTHKMAEAGHGAAPAIIGDGTDAASARAPAPVPAG